MFIRYCPPTTAFYDYGIILRYYISLQIFVQAIGPPPHVYALDTGQRKLTCGGMLQQKNNSLQSPLPLRIAGPKQAKTTKHFIGMA
jgi:hypothetical protein